MKIRVIKQLDLSNITLVYELEGCPEGCDLTHDDLDDEHGHDFNSHLCHEEAVFDYHFAELENEREDDLDTIAEAYETQELDRQDRMNSTYYF